MAHLPHLFKKPSASQFLFSILVLIGLGCSTIAAQAQPTVKTPTIMVFGDSLSAEYGLKRGTGWVSLLQDRLKRSGFPHLVSNASISGETTAGGLSRLPAALKRVKPDFVILELGGNDGLRGLPVGSTKKNLAQMVAMTRASGAIPLLVGIRVPPNYGPQYARQFDGLFQELARATETALVPFLLDGIAENPAMFQPDGIHPNEAAQPRLLDNVWPALNRLLVPAS
jgi:acyl-CoA thioesterase-1